MIKTHIYFRKLSLLYFLAVIFLFPFKSYGSSIIPDSACDPLYYETLSSRAWLEAQREITQNQNLILKPDSVFEYTCFDLLVGELATHAQQMFSETSAFGTPLGSTAMDQALSNLVLTPVSAYTGANFPTVGSLGGHTAGLAIKHYISSSAPSTPYTCDIMERIWHAAKCINFADNSARDGFFTFQEYATDPLDKRGLPDLCSPITFQWATNLTNALMTGPWTNDPVQVYMDEVSPQACAATGDCPCTGSPIPTGLTVTRASDTGSANTFQEHVCLQPGCRYHPGGVLTGSNPASSPTPGCYGR
ncbi:MAG: hypothetical protein GC137_01865 [Alphaproteobacteria bacterium]|nr:hypothetical protein [Alphaproteobacteria bacterium]